MVCKNDLAVQDSECDVAILSTTCNVSICVTQTYSLHQNTPDTLLGFDNLHSVQDEGIIPADKEKEWAEALIKIKSKDPSIYDASTRLFTGAPTDADESGDDDDDTVAGSKGSGKKTLREILYAQVCSKQLQTRRFFTKFCECPEFPDIFSYVWSTTFTHLTNIVLNVFSK